MVKRFKVLGTRTIDVSKDAYIDSSNPDINYGSEDSLNVTYNDTSNKKAYIGFTSETGFADVKNATLLIKGSDVLYNNKVYGLKDGQSWNENEITWNNAPANNISGEGLDADSVYTGTNFGHVTNDELISSIDVTEYLKSLSGKEATFVLESREKETVTLNYDFEDMASDGFKSGTHYRLGGQGSSSETVVTEEAYEGSKSLKFSGRTFGNRRIKIYNSLGTSALTEDDIGSIYKAEAYVKPSEDDVLKTGIFSASGTYGQTPYILESFDVYADKWNYVTFNFVVEEGMIADDVRLLGFETNAGTDTLYFDNIKVTKVSNANVITSKEGRTESKPMARLVIDASDNINKIVGDNVYIESGDSADKNLLASEVLYVKGADSVNTKGMQKGYVLVPLDGVDTASTVNLKFSTTTSSKNNLLVYGLDIDGLNAKMSYQNQGSEFGSAHAWTDIVTWNSAPGNDKVGVGVLEEHQYGGAPIAIIDASTPSEKTVDVTSYVKAMKEEGATYATFVLTAQNQAHTHTLDFEGDISKYEIKLSHSNSSYEIADGGADGTGKALRFIRVGTSENNGYDQNISIGNLIDPDNTWTDDDIGKTVSIKFKAMLKASQYTDDPATYGNTFATAIATLGASRNKKILGDAADATYGTYYTKSKISSNVWNDYELKFTITEEMLNSSDDYEKAALAIGANWGTGEIWIDDVNVEFYGDPITISSGKASDAQARTVKTYTFDEENCDISAITSQSSTDTLSIAEGEGINGTNALLFKKGAASFDNCFRIPYLINENNLLTEADIGKTYNISYKVKVKRLDGYTEGTNNLMAKISSSDAVNTDFGSTSTTEELKKVNSLGDAAETRNRTKFELDTWTDVNFTFTITSEMVENHSNRTYLVIGSYKNIGYVYIDDIVSTVTDPVLGGPSLELVAADSTVTTNNITYMNTVASSTPNTSYTGNMTIKREDYVDGVLDGKKSYLSFVFDNANVQLLKSAILKLNVLSTPAKDTQTLDIYAFTDADYDKTKITWNNAPGNNPNTNGILLSTVIGEAPIATITPNKGNVELDVTDYVKTLENDEKAVFALVTNDTPNIVTYLRDFKDGVNLSKPRDVRHGGNGTLEYAISEENGNKYLAVTGNVQSSSRLKFKDVFSKPYFTSADKGTQYKISYKMRPVSDVAVYTGIMSSYEGSAYSSKNDYDGGGYKGTSTLTAGKWNTVEFIYTVNDVTVENMLNSLCIEPHIAGCTFDLDDIKVEKLADGNEIEISKDASLEISSDESDDTENVAEISNIISSGDFNKGDSVVVNVLTETAFTNKVESVVFYVNGTEIEKSYTQNAGSSYSVELLNLDEGTYDVYAVVDFEKGESVTTETETITISSNVSYTDMLSEVSGKLENGSAYSVVKKVKSNLQKDVKAIALLGIYDAEGNLIKAVKSDETVIGSGRINTFKMNTGVLKDIPDGANAKVMVWSNFENILPCLASETLN